MNAYAPLVPYDDFMRRNRIDMWLTPDTDARKRRVLLRGADKVIRELPIPLRAAGDPPQEWMSAQMLRNIQYLVKAREIGGLAIMESLEDAFLHEEFDDVLRLTLGAAYDEFVDEVGFAEIPMAMAA